MVLDRAAPLGDYAVQRQVLLDPLDWVDGWPTVNGGYWASDSPQPAPAAQRGDQGRYQVKLKPLDQPGTLIASLSDAFDGGTLGAQRRQRQREKQR